MFHDFRRHVYFIIAAIFDTPLADAASRCLFYAIIITSDDIY